MTRFRLSLATTAAVAVAGITAVASLAAAHPLGPLVQISGPSPFASCVDAVPGLDLNTVVEPSVAATASGRAVVAWQQDRWGYPNEGGAHGLLASGSADAGASWGAPVWPTFTTCSGGTAANNGNWDRASDPWVTITPSGDALEIGLAFNWFDGRSAITVSRSSDGGTTWDTPTAVAVAPNNAFTTGYDKESITADPTRPGYVYAVWDRYWAQKSQSHDQGAGANSSKGPAMISRSTDGGKTWSNAQDLYNANDGTLGNQIVVLPNGTLLDFFVDYVVKSGRNAQFFTPYLSVVSSTDAGKTWTKRPVLVDPAPISCTGSVDPDVPGVLARDGCQLFSVAVDPRSGTLYAVWQDNTFSGGRVDQVAFTKSSDGGQTWSTPVRISQTPSGPSIPIVDQQAFTPTVAVAASGAVGVTYYDNRFDDPVTDQSTDAWGITSTDGGATWTETRLTDASFNINHAPFTGQCCFLGDYEGLAATGSGFLATFVVADNANNPGTFLDARRFAP
jgi:hypothetical protein